MDTLKLRSLVRNGYLRNARGFRAKALKEFREARRVQDELGIRQAAEKAWGAAVQAANALLEKHGRKIPKGMQRRLDLFVDLEKHNPRIKQLGLVDMLDHFLQVLHSGCFYDGTYSVKRVERALHRLDDFIGHIENLM